MGGVGDPNSLVFWSRWCSTTRARGQKVFGAQQIITTGSQQLSSSTFIQAKHARTPLSCKFLHRSPSQPYPSRRTRRALVVLKDVQTITNHALYLALCLFYKIAHSFLPHDVLNTLQHTLDAFGARSTVTAFGWQPTIGHLRTLRTYHHLKIILLRRVSSIRATISSILIWQSFCATVSFYRVSQPNSIGAVLSDVEDVSVIDQKPR